MIKNYILQALILLSVLYVSCSEEENEEILDSTAPTVNFTIKGVIKSDTEDLPIIGNTIEIEINAQDAKGISKVEAFLNNAKVGEDRDAPFKISIDLTQFSKKLNGKGTVLSKTHTQYTLKVTATDLAGNVSAIEQEIIVDNEMPTITEVSLKSNTVIGGVDNQVTFKVSDNEEITSLEVKLNEVVIETTALDSIAYTFNIDTSVLEDGQNNLIITASDQATNIATYNAPFIIDNTGPEITLEGLATEDGVVDESLVLSINAEDLYSKIDSLKIFVNDSIILKSDNSEINLDLNPDDYATGDNTLRVFAVDSIGNESTQEVNFTVKRLLLKINVPSEFLNPYMSNFYVFASDSSGDLLDIKAIEFNTTSIKLNTFVDVSLDTEYMLNFAFLFRAEGERSYIKTIQNVKRSTLDKIDLKIPEERIFLAENKYPASEMSNDFIAVGQGTDYTFYYNYSNELTIEEYKFANTDATSNRHYVYFYNTVNNNYEYQFIDKPVAADFTFDYRNSSTDGVETRYFNSPSIQDPKNFSFLHLYGYLSDTDFDNDIKHLIWDYGNQNAIIMDGYRYIFNTNFYKYRYLLTIENYRVEAVGEPLEFYNAPEWSIDYSYSSIDKSFSLSKSGTTHNIGKITMQHFSGYNHYAWNIIFDSQASNEIILPKLPKELQTWDINNYYTSGDLTIEQIEVKRYEGLDNYDAFLQTVIKNNIYQQHKVSDKIESIVKSETQGYSSKPDFSFIHY